MFVLVTCIMLLLKRQNSLSTTQTVSINIIILVIGNTVIDTQPCVTNLGCVLDFGLVMSGHAARMCKSAYHHLGCIRKIRNCIPMEACKACMLLVHSLVTPRLDYSNALLCGARDDVFKQLECVQRIAERVVCKKYTNDHRSVTELIGDCIGFPSKHEFNTRYYYLCTKLSIPVPHLTGQPCLLESPFAG